MKIHVEKDFLLILLGLVEWAEAISADIGVQVIQYGPWHKLADIRTKQDTLAGIRRELQKVINGGEASEARATSTNKPKKLVRFYDRNRKTKGE